MLSVSFNDTLVTIDELNVFISYMATYYLGERVQFIYNGAVCQGTVIQLLYGPVDRIIIEVDVSTNYSALNNLSYNRIVFNQQNTVLTRVSPPVWY